MPISCHFWTRVPDLYLYRTGVEIETERETERRGDRQIDRGEETDRETCSVAMTSFWQRDGWCQPTWSNISSRQSILHELHTKYFDYSAHKHRVIMYAYKLEIKDPKQPLHYLLPGQHPPSVRKMNRCTLLHRCVICFHSIRPNF